LRELRNLRLRRGLSQADLSAKTGVAEFTISEIEAGKRPNARPSTLRKLAQGLGVEVTDLYGVPDIHLGEAPPHTEQRSFNHLLEDERRISEYQRWADFIDRYANRWERLIETGNFGAGNIEEFYALLEDVQPTLLELGLREKHEQPPGYMHTWGPTMSKPIMRLYHLFEPLIPAIRAKLDNSELERARRKREEQEATFGDAIRRGA
jgi:transcriptional regulator with XRE-family HTH domain